MRVLDFGCGVGDVAFLLAEAVGRSRPVVGVDREARAVAHLAAASSMRFFQRALPNHDIAGRVVACFEDAGPPEPQVLWESIVSSSDPKFLQWFASTYVHVLPHMERMGLAHPGVGNASTLFDRILTAASGTRNQFVSVPQVSA